MPNRVRKQKPSNAEAEAAASAIAQAIRRLSVAREYEIDAKTEKRWTRAAGKSEQHQTVAEAFLVLTSAEVMDTILAVLRHANVVGQSAPWPGRSAHVNPSILNQTLALRFAALINGDSA